MVRFIQIKDDEQDFFLNSNFILRIRSGKIEGRERTIIDLSCKERGIVTTLSKKVILDMVYKINE